MRTSRGEKPLRAPITSSLLAVLCTGVALNSCRPVVKDTASSDSADTSVDSADTSVDSGGPRCLGSGAWTGVTASFNGTCGIHEDGCVECWTATDTGPMTPQVNDTGYYGPMGNLVPPEGSYTAVDLPRCTDWGTHACAIRQSDGGIDCWGSDAWRENSPPAGEFTRLSLGKHDSCALGTDGRIACWGKRIGAGKVATYTADTDYVDLSNCGSVCGLASDGHVDCWDIGHETHLFVSEGPWTAIDNDWAEVIGVTPEGYVSSTSTSLDLPQPKSGAVDLCLANAGGGCVLDMEGRVTCTGEAGGDRGGKGPPAEIFVSIDCGYSHACGVTTDGLIECWGNCQWGRCDVPEHE